MSQSSFVAALKQLSGPHHIDEETPPFWLRKDGYTARAIFESVEAFMLFNERYNHFSGEVVEVRHDGVVEIPLGVLQ